MNKKGKFYPYNKSTANNKNKDNQQKSNKNTILSRSMEKRKKANPPLDQISDKYTKVKYSQNYGLYRNKC